jgi:hypothetical protein
MANKSLNGVLQSICKLAAVQSARELADHELLQRFVAGTRLRSQFCFSGTAR